MLPCGVATVTPVVPAHWSRRLHVRLHNIHQACCCDCTRCRLSLPWGQGHTAMSGSGEAGQGGRAVGPDWTDSLVAFRSSSPAGLTVEYGCEVASLVRPQVDVGMFIPCASQLAARTPELTVSCPVPLRLQAAPSTGLQGPQRCWPGRRLMPGHSIPLVPHGLAPTAHLAKPRLPFHPTGRRQPDGGAVGAVACHSAAQQWQRAWR